MAEALVEEGRQFDAVMALEVVEHVADPLGFCRSLGRLCRTGGGCFMSTINRTPRAYALAIGAAEYILRWVNVQALLVFLAEPSKRGRWG
jgi:polyprenyldihydroxybenzoate methyltransferase/3-demethylubiquinol 3-O-methyltransferase